MRELAWMIPVGPFAAFGLIALGAHRSKGLSQGLAIAGIVIAVVLSQLVFLGVVIDPTPERVPVADWYTLGTERAVLSTQVDPTDAIMVAMVSFVCLLIFVYSLGYMEADRRSSRYFAYVSLFAGAMLGAMVSGDLLALFIFWEIMGTCSYLLIGFWWERESASRAALKAFLVTKVGDLFLMMGLVLLYAQVGSLAYSDVFDPETVRRLATTPYIGSLSVASVAVLLLFGGTMGKSAQFPLHVWLPDAMEGPTPASALIHAATMVSAGVYLMIRAFPLLSVSQVMPVVASVGVVTALYASIVAVAQSDIKRVLAFSTISQLGYMVAALGIGAYTASLFHLVTHAFFKALLFLAAGSVIHGIEHGHRHTFGHAVPAHVPEPDFSPNDMWKMGGLAFRMPVTAATFLAGGLALSGFPVLSAGFWSKDEILAQAWNASRWVFWGLVIAAAITAFYSARQIALTFLGTPRSKAAVYARENKTVMVVPLIVLALFAICLGWVGIPHGFPLLGRIVPNWFGDFSSLSLVGLADTLGEAGHPEQVALPPLVFGMVATLGGLASGWWVYGRPAVTGATLEHDPLSQAMARLRLGWLYRAAEQRFYIDAIHAAVVVGPTLGLAKVCSWIDRKVIDAAVVKFGRGFGEGGRIAPVADRVDRKLIDAAVVTFGKGFGEGGRVAPAADRIDRRLFDGLTEGTGLLSSLVARIVVVLDGGVVDGVVNASGFLGRGLASLSDLLDGSVLDGLVRAVAGAFGVIGRWMRRIQTGLLPDYLWNAFMIILLLVAVLVMFRRI